MAESCQWRACFTSSGYSSLALRASSLALGAFSSFLKCFCNVVLAIYRIETNGINQREVSPASPT